VRTFVSLLVYCWSFSTTLHTADLAHTEVKNVVQRFHEALDRHDVAAIGGLVSPDVVVFENGHRNDGWTDFRDNHLIPEFKEPASPSKWEFVEGRHQCRDGVGLYQTDDRGDRDGKHAGYLVWSAYVLQKAGSTWKVVLLDWSARRLGPAD
jgi:ketosteroid isomerase-like protein